VLEGALGRVPWAPLPDESDAGARPLGPSLDVLAKALGAPGPDTVSSVFSGWAAAVGEPLAAHCKPVRLRAGTLSIEVDDPAWATQVRYTEAEIVERLRRAGASAELARIEVRVRRGSVRPTRPPDRMNDPGPGH
jgi:predicted nucleic acid-binding Zn ribbon protein